LFPILTILQKVILRSSEHGDVIETQEIKICPSQRFLSYSVPDEMWGWIANGAGQRSNIQCQSTLRKNRKQKQTKFLKRAKI